MIGIIKRHNRLNGVTFCIVEFVLIALTFGAFSTCYVIRRDIVLSLIGCGITLNCLAVAVIGIRMLIDPKEAKIRVPPFWRKIARQ
jgi:hypothetical protein